MEKYPSLNYPYFLLKILLCDLYEFKISLVFGKLQKHIIYV